MTGFGDILKTVKVKGTKARKHDLTPEKLAQEPVYVRFTKAQIEILEEELWKRKMLGEGQNLTPRTLHAVFMGMLEASEDLKGFKFDTARKVLARPNVIRR